jgi:hypothetical protein
MDVLKKELRVNFAEINNYQDAKRKNDTTNHK